jgi:DNA damage-inducible protein 1
MFLIVVNASDGNKEVIVELSSPAEQTLAVLKSKCAAAFGIAESEMSITFAGMSITAEAPLNSQVTDGATLTLQKVAKRKFFLHDIPPNANAETLISLCDEHEGLLGQLMEVDTDLGTALTSKNVPQVRMLLMKRMMSAHKGSFAKQQELNKLHSDPDNPENQRRMMELIQEEQIKAAHEMAMEENPESFAQVYMLYVNLSVQGRSLPL